MNEVLVRIQGTGTNPAEIARRKTTIVDLAKLYSALSSNVTNLTFTLITVHIWFGEISKAQAFAVACQKHKPLISVAEPTQSRFIQ